MYNKIYNFLKLKIVKALAGFELYPSAICCLTSRMWNSYQFAEFIYFYFDRKKNHNMEASCASFIGSFCQKVRSLLDSFSYWTLGSDFFYILQQQQNCKIQHIFPLALRKVGVLLCTFLGMCHDLKVATNLLVIKKLQIYKWVRSLYTK